MIIAIDIGGTHTRVAGFKSTEKPRLLDLKQFRSENRYEQDLSHILSSIHSLQGNQTIEKIGIGVPAVFNENRSEVLHYTNLPDWNGRSFIQDLNNEFNCPVRFENDAAVAALGEAFYGHGVGRSFLHLTWGTGIGGAAVEQQEGKTFLNPFEPGHQILDNAATNACNCGQKGCWEYFCGGGGIQKRLGKNVTELSSDEWSEVLERFAQGVINLIAIRPVNLVTIGGGIAGKRPNGIQEVAALVQKRLKIFSMPEITLSKLGEEGGLMGALGLFKL